MKKIIISALIGAAIIGAAAAIAYTLLDIEICNEDDDNLDFD